MSHHQVDFFEIPVTDLAAAKAFYGGVFGWTFVDYGPHYADIHGAGPSGGLRPVDRAPGYRGGPLIILYSDDLDATEAAITAAGGRVLERHEFPGGRRFHFADPFDNELAVWTKA